MDYDDICIICLENISNIEAVWSCSTCYCEYHLVCINDWISQYRNCKQRILIDEQESLNLSEGFTNAQTRLNKLINDVDHWSCPKCRNEYSNQEAPNKYLCYCGKICDPKNNHWLQPHSCGERCGKFLKPYCGDICLELCHRGPCPPCPKMLNNVSCHCGKQCQPAIRCSQRYWSCGAICGKSFDCNIHICQDICHNNCGTCQSMVDKYCLCGEHHKMVKCSENWQCSKNCKKVDESLANKCPCGKSSLDILKNDGDGYQQMTCKDSCDKLLDCGVHKCPDKCHLKDCSNCRQMVSKSCRCGATVAMVLCHKKLTCNTKCVRWKNCNKHQCKRRCCDPNLGCAPCDIICNNVLSCRKHRCQLRYHSGPCYPCQKTVDVSCACETMVKRVACGVNLYNIREHLNKSCVNFCQIASKCHHENRHKCHSKNFDCPPCQNRCLNVLSCQHTCQKICHDYIKTTIRLDKSKLAGPWEALEDGKIKYVSQPCPPCKVELSLVCFGGHDMIKYPCYQPLKFGSCGRPCARLLPCGNHSCSIECHPVSEQKCPDKLLGEAVYSMETSSYCEDSCNKICSKSLQKNRCEHPCSIITCHKGPCPPCTRYISYKCYCGALDMHIECHLGPNPPPEKLSCPSRCPRYLKTSCGHQCPRNCHPGDCENGKVQCKTKVVQKCPCGIKKMSIACWKMKNFKLECDPVKCDPMISGDCVVRKRKILSNGNDVDDVIPYNNNYYWFYVHKMKFLIVILIAILVIIGCYFNYESSP